MLPKVQVKPYGGSATVKVFWEPSDVGRAVGVVPGTVKMDAALGKLRVAAVTRRGVRLFLPEDVERYRRARAAHTGQRARNGDRLR